MFAHFNVIVGLQMQQKPEEPGFAHGTVQTDVKIWALLASDVFILRPATQHLIPEETATDIKSKS